MIPAEAVEAAAKVLDPQTMGSGGALAEKFKTETREEARHILEAAAPHMMAVAWDAGYLACVDDIFRDNELRKQGSGLDAENSTRNPYKADPNV